MRKSSGSKFRSNLELSNAMRSVMVERDDQTRRPVYAPRRPNTESAARSGHVQGSLGDEARGGFATPSRARVGESARWRWGGYGAACVSEEPANSIERPVGSGLLWNSFLIGYAALVKRHEDARTKTGTRRVFIARNEESASPSTMGKSSLVFRA